MDTIEDPYKTLEANIADKGNRPIFFIGAGITRRYLNGPNWQGLLDQLINNIGLDKPYEYFFQKQSGSYERIASELVNYYFEKAWEAKIKKIDNDDYKLEFFKENYHKSIFLKVEIAKIFKKLLTDFKKSDSKSIKAELDSFSQTNPAAIITTNYDELLEKIVFKDFKSIIGQRVISDRIKGKNGRVLKIHGCVTKPESIVISENDYEIFISKQKYLSAKLLTFFVEYPIIIMGYSLSDRNILGILETISEIDIYGNSLKQKADNIWFINYSPSNLEKKDVLLEKEIVLSNNKIILINYINVKTYDKLFESIIGTNKYPYSLTAMANELGYSHWKQIEKYIQIIEEREKIKVSNTPEYFIRYKSAKRYSEAFFNKLKEEVK